MTAPARCHDRAYSWPDMRLPAAIARCELPPGHDGPHESREHGELRQWPNFTTEQRAHATLPLDLSAMLGLAHEHEVADPAIVLTTVRALLDIANAANAVVTAAQHGRIGGGPTLAHPTLDRLRRALATYRELPA